MENINSSIKEALGIDVSEKDPLENFKTTVGLMRDGLYQAYRDGAGDKYDTTSCVQDTLVDNILFSDFNVEHYSSDEVVLGTTVELIPIAFKKAYEGGAEVK